MVGIAKAACQSLPQILLLCIRLKDKLLSLLLFFFIVMTILKSTSLFLRKTGSGSDSSGAGAMGTRVARYPEPRKTPLRNWSISSFTRFSSQRTLKYHPRRYQDSENRPLIRHLPNGRKSDSSSPDVPLSDAVCPTSPEDSYTHEAGHVLHFPLIPLAIAQRRQEIRRRIAEFTSTGGGSFAVQTNGLLPLAEAITRNDIRRRKEGFELLEDDKIRRVRTIFNSSENTDGVNLPLSRDIPGAEAEPEVPSDPMDESIYSLPSFVEPESQALSSFDEDVLGRLSTSISYPALDALTIHDYAAPPRRSRPQAMRPSPVPHRGAREEMSLDSSGEGSLMRIAVTELGW